MRFWPSASTWPTTRRSDPSARKERSNTVHDMKVIIFCGIIYCIVKIIGKLNEREKQNRIVREQESIKAEQTRQREQIRAEMERARLETKERIEAEKRRIEWQKRQDAINARLEKEQERQAAQLERHEDLIMKLNFRLEKAEDEIYHFTSVLETLVSQRESMQTELDSIIAKTTAQDEKRKLDAKFMELSYASAEKYAEVAGNALNGQNQAKETEKMLKRKATLEGKLITLDNRIFTTEQRIKKAEYEKYEAERKLA